MPEWIRHTPQTVAEARKAVFKPHIVWQTVIFIVLLFGLQFLSLLPLAIAEYMSYRPVPAYWMLFTTAIVAAGFILYGRAVQRRSPRSMGFTRKGIGRSYITGFITGTAMMGACTGICVAAGALELECIYSRIAPGTLALWLAGFAIQGMEEEISLRGVFMTGACTRIPVWAAVILNSVVFAALHLFNNGINFVAVVNLTLFGVLASLYFLRTDSIWGIGALHSAWNFAQGCLFGIPVSGMTTGDSVLRFSAVGRPLLSGGEFGIEGGIAATAVLAVTTAAIIFLPNGKTSPRAHSSL